MLILHILTAILFLGPVTVATSTFHVKALAAHNRDTDARGAAALLHKISSTYGMLSLLVPLLGIAEFIAEGLFSEGQFHAAIGLSVVAWAVLFFLILPRQRKMIAALGLDAEAGATEIADWKKAKGQLSMFAGIFNLLWLVTAGLMFI
ncbi:hypothetical protein CKALI_04370 [Corynebacterium kalinowskii]|uniref:DUF2269 domain-containing protein n=1 Tax=Corynebacterium kalinowskii TaxID=2675216 RepID=A0A6B8VC73_9CORY|nr:DUF2269 domain-containing protein [Corynebacterium kalinowskii]QGU01753.1 hypothetical protein CKALI_04370 [Corynebacterium kalinowskii]